LRDQPPLELRERGKHVRHRLTARSRGVDGTVERDERSVLLLRRAHQRGEIDHRAGEASFATTSEDASPALSTRSASCTPGRFMSLQRQNASLVRCSALQLAWPDF